MIVVNDIEIYEQEIVSTPENLEHRGEFYNLDSTNTADDCTHNCHNWNDWEKDCAHDNNADIDFIAGYLHQEISSCGLVGECLVPGSESCNDDTNP